jgi:hypothetical protein
VSPLLYQCGCCYEYRDLTLGLNIVLQQVCRIDALKPTQGPSAYAQMQRGSSKRQYDKCCSSSAMYQVAQAGHVTSNTVQIDPSAVLPLHVSITLSQETSITQPRSRSSRSAAGPSGCAFWQTPSC